MKKKILGTVVAAILTVTMAATTFAAGSKTATAAPTVSAETAALYEVSTEDAKAAISEASEEGKALAEALTDYETALKEGNEAEREATKAMVADCSTNMTEEEVKAVEEYVDKTEAITMLDTIVAKEGAEPNEEGKYELELTYTQLTEELKDAKLSFLFYNVTKGITEVIEILPEDIDFETQTIKVALELPGLVQLRMEEAAA